jgi:cytochrome P450
MSSTLIVIGACLVLWLLQYYVSVFFQNRRLQRISAQRNCAPPPTRRLRWPFGIERVVRILKFRGDLLDDIISMIFFRQRAWTLAVEMPLMKHPIVSTVEPANLKAMLATDFANWGVGPRRLLQLGPFLGLGVFTADGESWTQARGLLKPVFVRQQVADLRSTERHVDRLLRCLGVGAVSKDGWTSWIDAKPLVFRFTLDAATEFLFGESVESQAVTVMGQADLQSQNHFESAFESSSLGVGLRMRLGSFYWMLNYHLGWRRACNVCKDYATRFVDDALKLRAEGEKVEDGTVKGIFLRQLAEFTQDRTVLRDQLMQLLFAGRDTTATLICFALLCLARNPDAWQKMRAEVLDHFGSDNSSEMSFETLKSCAYLQHVLQETLRLYPPIPINMRQALRDTVLPTGGGPDGNQPIAIAKGTGVTFSVYVMHRRKDLWGEDAAEWKPERWAGLKPGWNYLAFSGGPRHCPGRE